MENWGDYETLQAQSSSRSTRVPWGLPGRRDWQWKKEENKGNEDTDDSNPFVALIGGYEKTSAGKKPGEEKKENQLENKIWWPSKESFIEENSLRPLAEEKAKEMIFRIFDVYKKAHGMASYTWIH